MGWRCVRGVVLVLGELSDTSDLQKVMYAKKLTQY